MKDYCLRATAANGQIRAFAASSRFLVDEAASIHKTTPVATAALGRLLTAASIMGLMSGNDEDSTTVSIKGDGVLGGVLAVTDGMGRVRGYAHHPQADVPNRADGKLNVGGGIGKGKLTVSKDVGLKEPYNGTIELISGEIAEDIAAYFVLSEQTPSIVSLGVLVDKDHSVKAAGGFFIQLLPGVWGDIIDQLEEHIGNFPPISALLNEGNTPEQILHKLLEPFGYEITQNSPISFYCPCSKERAFGAVVAMGRKEITEILTEDGKADIECHFCLSKYHFEAKELQKILEKMGDE
ncbi:MAG: Hsp33 family molecular chaperone HslO [Defluviitaleaceae bacterium]|nr:Hsp33 family molecular chaperone HslO [Defluviitaleaceae bacterium]